MDLPAWQQLSAEARPSGGEMFHPFTASAAQTTSCFCPLFSAWTHIHGTSPNTQPPELLLEFITPQFSFPDPLRRKLGFDYATAVFSD